MLFTEADSFIEAFGGCVSALGRSSGRRQISAATPGTSAAPGSIDLLSLHPCQRKTCQWTRRGRCARVRHSGLRWQGAVRREVLMDGLKHLEYRGYDSAGLAVQARRPDRDDQAGRASGQSGRGTRRAQRVPLGGLGRGGSHPLGDARPSPARSTPIPRSVTDGVAVVHNGIIENFAELKQEVRGRGVTFTPTRTRRS